MLILSKRTNTLNSLNFRRLEIKTLLLSRSYLTPSIQGVPDCCCSKGTAPYWSNPLFLVVDIQALWCSVLSARAPECQKIKNSGLDQYGKV